MVSASASVALRVIPRVATLNSPRTLHHAMIRGIEGFKHI